MSLFGFGESKDTDVLILNKLDNNDVLQLSAVNRKCRDFVSHDDFWKLRCLHIYGDNNNDQEMAEQLRHWYVHFKLPSWKAYCLELSNKVLRSPNPYFEAALADEHNRSDIVFLISRSRNARVKRISDDTNEDFYATFYIRIVDEGASKLEGHLIETHSTTNEHVSVLFNGGKRVEETRQRNGILRQHSYFDERDRTIKTVKYDLKENVKSVKTFTYGEGDSVVKQHFVA